MFIIRKKRIIMLLSFVFVAILVASIGQNNKKINTVETVATPVTNKVIVVDAGHGIPDEGVSLLH